MFSPDTQKLSSTDSSAAPALGSGRGSELTLVQKHSPRDVAVARPQVLAASPTPLALLQALRRRWRFALLVGILLGAVGALVAYQLSPPTTRVRTLLQIAAVRPYIAFENADARVDFVNYQRAQAGMVKSRKVINSILKESEVARLPVLQGSRAPEEWIERHLQVDFSIAPEIMSISMVGERPQELKVIVDAIRDVYLRDIVGEEKQRRNRRLNALKELWKEYEDKQKTQLNALKAI